MKDKAAQAATGSVEMSTEVELSQPYQGGVYVIQARGKHGRKQIKIGHTNNVVVRLKALQTAHASPLKLLYTIPCDSREEAIKLEQSLHTRYWRKHVGGEWFDYRAGMGDHFAKLIESPEALAKQVACARKSNRQRNIDRANNLTAHKRRQLLTSAPNTHKRSLFKTPTGQLIPLVRQGDPPDLWDAQVSKGCH